MNTPRAVGLAVLCAAVAFAAGWLLKPIPEPEGDARPAAAPPDDAAQQAPREATLGSDAMQLASVRRELAEERQRHHETGKALAEVRQQLELAKAPAQRVPTPTETSEDPKAPRYSFQAVSEVLASVDWQATGESIVKMGPLLTEFAESLAQGQGLPSSAADLQRWTAPLLRLALEAQNQGVPGTGIPGTFGHPSIVVNMVHAALEQGGTPLTARQAERLGELGTSFVLEDERRLASYDESTFQIQRSVEEAALKDRLYEAIDALVTDEQREILHPEAVRGRLGLDLFSSAVLWNGICGPIRFQERTDLAQNFAKVAAQRVTIAPELRPMLDELAAEWARGFPDEFLAEEPDALQRAGMSIGGNTGMPVARARVAAQHAVAFYRALYERLPADSDSAAALRASALVPVPVRWVEPTKTD